MSADEYPTLDPLELDLRQPDGALRAKCASLQAALSPIFALRHHGCEALCRRVVAETRERGGVERATEPQLSCELDSPLADELRACLDALALRVLRILTDDAAPELLAARGERISGRLSMRVYPPQPTASAAAPRLGAHCDSTLLTFLFADRPGLQVLRDAGWTPEQAMACGLPVPSDALEGAGEPSWANVRGEDGDALLVTFGREWVARQAQPDCPAARLPVRSAVLHRVLVPPDGATVARHSLPFLIDVRPVAEPDS